MACWDEVLKEVSSIPNVLDVTREKYIKELSDFTGRNTICYYSSFLTKQAQNTGIIDNDINGLMTAIKGMDCTKGLDLIFHTQGGSPEAAEAIVSYLKSKFGNNIRVIVPQIAMSAGTMIACAGSEIFMGKHSSLGPIDPQFGAGISAYNVVWEFEQAQTELRKHPEDVNYWRMRLQQYPASFLKSALDAINLSSELVSNWLLSNMFSNDENKKEKVARVVSNLNEHDKSKTHGRHLNIDKCREYGLKVTELESSQDFQDRVLSIHHAFMISIDKTNIIKIIEGNNGRRVLLTQNV